METIMSNNESGKQKIIAGSEDRLFKKKRQSIIAAIKSEKIRN